MTYLHVRLTNDERWNYHPEPGHDVAWLAVNRGTLHVAGATLLEGERNSVAFKDTPGVAALYR